MTWRGLSSEAANVWTAATVTNSMPSSVLLRLWSVGTPTASGSIGFQNSPQGMQGRTKPYLGSDSRVPTDSRTPGTDRTASCLPNYESED